MPICATQQWAYSVGGSLSLIGSVSLLIAHIFMPRLQKPPWDLIVGQLASQVILDVSWIYAYAHYALNYSDDENHNVWMTIGGISVWGWFIMMNYLVALSIEVYRMARQPVFAGFRWQYIIYHGSCIFVATIFLIIVASMDSFGVSRLKTCWIKENHPMIVIVLIPFVVHFPISIALWSYALCVLGNNKGAKLYTIFIFLAYALQLPTGLSFFVSFFMLDVHSYNFEVFGAVTGAITGFVLSIYRYIEAFHLNSDNQNRTSLSTNSLTATFIQQDEFFENILLEGISNCLLALSLVFKENRENTKTHKGNIYSQEYRWDFPANDKRRESYKVSVNSSESIKRVPYQVIEYAPQAFEIIRKEDSITQQILLESISPYRNEEGLLKNAKPTGGGRSGAFFFFTHDRRFILKSITDTDRKTFIQNLLEDYWDYLTDINTDSVLSRVYGVYKIKIGKAQALTIQILGNIVPNPTNVRVAAMFDLKGSKLDREVVKDGLTCEIIDPGKVYKDIDFQKCFGWIMFSSKDTRENLLKALKEDVDMLECHNIMDYSMLMWLVPLDQPLPPSKFVFTGDEYHYVIGIIDFLQIYNLKKKFETAIKRGRDSKAVSSIHPKEYKQRFMDKISSYIM